jgi:hypothetical protein
MATSQNHKNDTGQKKVKILNEQWDTITNILPCGWEEEAKNLGAMKRKLPSFKSCSELLQTLLIHVGKGCSLRETSALVKLYGIADVSDVGILKALRRSEAWLKSMCMKLFIENGFDNKIEDNSCFNMKIIDGTLVKEPGRTGSLWRLHYCMNLPNLSCSYSKLTPANGEGNGEKTHIFPAKENDCFIGDAGFSKYSNIEYLVSQKAHCIIRVNYATIKFAKDGKKFDLIEALKDIGSQNEIGEWDVSVVSNKGKEIKGRICAILKSNREIEKALKKVRRQQVKNQRKARPETFIYARYVILFTSISKSIFTASQILNWYRIRWQVEIVFKRFKSIAGLGHLPKYDDVSARAWLYAKLLLCLLTQNLIDYAKKFSPWGYKVCTTSI